MPLVHMHVYDQTSLDLVMDGVLISHGKTQKHIWAYATAHQKHYTKINITKHTVHVLTTDIMVLFHHSLEMTTIVIVE